MGRLA